MSYTLEYSPQELGNVFHFIDAFDRKYNVLTMKKPQNVWHQDSGKLMLQQVWADVFLQAPNIYQCGAVIKKLCAEIKRGIYEYVTRLVGKPIDNRFVATDIKDYFENLDSSVHHALVTGILAGTGPLPSNDIDTLIGTVENILNTFLRELYNTQTETLDNWKKQFPGSWLLYLIEHIRGSMLKERSKPKHDIFPKHLRHPQQPNPQQSYQQQQPNPQQSYQQQQPNPQSYQQQQPNPADFSDASMQHLLGFIDGQKQQPYPQPKPTAFSAASLANFGRKVDAHQASIWKTKFGGSRRKSIRNKRRRSRLQRF
jgi:hypothetical protein